MRSISTVQSTYFRILSAPLLITFLSPVTATSVNMHVPCLLPHIMLSGLLLALLVPQYGNLIFMTCFYQFRYMVIPLFVVQFYPYFHAYVKVQSSTLSIMSPYVLFFCQFGHADMMCPTVSSNNNNYYCYYYA